MGLQDDPLQFAAVIRVATYVAAEAHDAVAERSWNGAYCRSHGVRLQTPSVEPSALMMFWPFLFFQKPIVKAPVCGGTRQTATVRLDVWFVSIILAVFG